MSVKKSIATMRATQATSASVLSETTKSPWEINTEKRTGPGQVDWLWIMSGQTRIARVVLYTQERAEMLANARLIAMAPDLLRALEAIETQGRQITDPNNLFGLRMTNMASKALNSVADDRVSSS